MYSKYERRTDTRTYDDRRKLYEGGWDVLYTELLEKNWKEKMDEWTGRPKCEYRKKYKDKIFIDYLNIENTKSSYYIIIFQNMNKRENPITPVLLRTFK